MEKNLKRRYTLSIVMLQVSKLESHTLSSCFFPKRYMSLLSMHIRQSIPLFLICFWEMRTIARIIVATRKLLEIAVFIRTDSSLVDDIRLGMIRV